MKWCCSNLLDLAAACQWYSNISRQMDDIHQQLRCRLYVETLNYAIPQYLLYKPIDCPTRLSMLLSFILLFGFWWWSSLFHNPDYTEVWHCNELRKYKCLRFEKSHENRNSFSNLLMIDLTPPRTPFLCRKPFISSSSSSTLSASVKMISPQGSPITCR